MKIYVGVDIFIKFQFLFLKYSNNIFYFILRCLVFKKVGLPLKLTIGFKKKEKGFREKNQVTFTCCIDGF